MGKHTGFSLEWSPAEYFFHVSYLEGNCYKSHDEESKYYDTEYSAYCHFKSLLERFKVDGSSYYLCRWGLQSHKIALDKADADDIGGV